MDSKDTASAAEAAAVQGERVEDLSQRTENASVYANENGTFTQRDFGGAVRVKHSGDWVPVDYSLIKQADGTYAPRASDLDITIDGGSAKEAARVTRDDGTSLAFTWPTNLPEPTVDGGVATYEISEATDLVVTITGSGVTARIRLNEKPADDDPVFQLGLRADGVDVDQTSTGTLKITDEAGKTVGSTTQLSAWDATTDAAGDPANVVELGAELNTTSRNGDVTQHALKLTTPDGWLSDPARSWPITIDPDISMEKTRDTWVRSGDTTSHGSDYKLIVGKINPATTTNPGPTRSYLKFYNGTIDNSSNIEIISAEMGLWQYYSYDCGARRMYVYPVGSAWSDAITWANKPDIVYGNGATHTEVTHGATGCGDGWTTVNLTAMAKAWNAGTVAMQGVRLSVGDETMSAYERRFCSMNPDSSIGSCGTAARRPYLDTTYNTRPTAPTSAPLVTRANGTAIASATVSDPDGGMVHAEFLVKRGTVTVFNKFSLSATPGVQTVTLPNLPLGTYSVTARAYDGRLFSSWSTASSFTGPLVTEPLVMESPEFPAEPSSNSEEELAEAGAPWLDETEVLFEEQTMEVSSEVQALAATEESAVLLEDGSDGSDMLRSIDYEGAEQTLFEGQLDGVPVADEVGHLVAWTGQDTNGEPTAFAYDNSSGETHKLPIDVNLRVFVVTSDGDIYLSDGNADPTVWSPFREETQVRQAERFGEEGGLVTDAHEDLTFEAFAEGSRLVSNGQVVHTFDEQFFGRFDPTGNYVLLNDTSTLLVWDIVGSRTVDLSHDSTALPSASWAADGRVLLTPMEGAAESLSDCEGEGTLESPLACETDEPAETPSGFDDHRYLCQVDQAEASCENVGLQPEVTAPANEASALGQFGEFLVQ